jgi:hypothetical protein
MIHYAFPPDPVETHCVVEAESLQLSAATINQVLNSKDPHLIKRICPAACQPFDSAACADWAIAGIKISGPWDIITQMNCRLRRPYQIEGQFVLRCTGPLGHLSQVR